MKNYSILMLFFLFAIGNINAVEKSKKSDPANDYYETSVTFPANFSVGDYIEFVGVQPISAGASGYYEISITYTRGNIAAAATHVAAISHANPNLWREVGCTNRNKYVDSEQNFTIDCNTGASKFRVRAINTFGVTDVPLIVYIKIRSINFNGSFTPLNATGKDLTVNKFLPMTNEWELYVGNIRDADKSASIAIKALANGNVGIGTSAPSEKLSVNGKIRAREVKVEATNWPDYVFEKGYKVSDLDELESYIKANKHLPGIPAAREVANNGIELGEMNKKLLEKIEELTIHLIKLDKKVVALEMENKKLNKSKVSMHQQKAKR